MIKKNYIVVVLTDIVFAIRVMILVGMVISAFHFH